MLQRGLLLPVVVPVVPEVPQPVLVLLSTCYKTHVMLLELKILHAVPVLVRAKVLLVVVVVVLVVVDVDILGGGRHRRYQPSCRRNDRRSSAPLVLVWMATEAMGRKTKEVVMVLVVGSDGSIRFLS